MPPPFILLSMFEQFCCHVINFYFSTSMIPEAVHIGGNKVVGLATLAGYLAAVGFKVFE